MRRSLTVVLAGCLLVLLPGCTAPTPASPDAAGDLSVEVPDVTGIYVNAALNVLEVAGLEGASPGAGPDQIVDTQDIAPGTMVEEGSIVFLTGRAPTWGTPSTATGDEPTLVDTADGEDEVDPPAQVEYRISSDAPIASVTYNKPGTFNISQAIGVKAKWKKVWKFVTTGDTILTLSAQTGPGGTRISCAIYVDGEKVNYNKSTGQYAVVTCNATS